MTETPNFTIRFWGVRGSIPTPGPKTARYGGNTSCIEVRAGGHVFVIDGGTGVRDLGARLVKEKCRSVDLFFTHTHLDHISGIPFFQPAYLPAIQVRFWAGHLLPKTGIRDVLCDLMKAPLFPVPVGVFENCEFRDFECGEPVEPKPGVLFRSFSLNHPNRACGYRIEHRGRAVCIITDNEHVPGQLDEALVEFVRGAEVMIYDAMYTDEEFPHFVSWGHSTWQECLRVAKAAGVPRPVLFHHDPNHGDSVLDTIASKAEAMLPGALVAREGMVIEV